MYSVIIRTYTPYDMDSLTFSYQDRADQHHGAKIQKHAFRFWQRYTTQKKLKYSKLQFKSNNCGLFTDHCSLPPIFNYWTLICIHVLCSFYTLIGMSARHLPRGALNSKPHKHYSSGGARSLSRLRAGVRQELESRSCTGSVCYAWGPLPRGGCPPPRFWRKIFQYIPPPPRFWRVL